MSLLSGQQLIEALGSTKGDVYVLRNGAQRVRVAPAAAIRLVCSGDYEGECRSRRVRFIRERDTRLPMVTDLHHWDGRTCRHYDGPITSHTVELWDLILAARGTRA